MHGSRSGGGGDDDTTAEEDDEVEHNNKIDNNNKDDKGVSALGLDRDLRFFAERSEENPCGAASFAKRR